ncbi:MAG: hypothetical protein GY814_20790, partial [Gammaproteobacteria bacterium]|nr:hypothetical protein [Gammaproteobacteria bacterium]
MFNVFVTYSDGEVHPVTGDDWRITWKSEDTSVATVSEGIVTTLKPGVVTINASFDDSIVLKEASETIEVVAAIPERLLISVANGEPLGPLPIGATRQYTALVAYTNGDTHTVTNEALWYAEPIYGYGEVEVGQGDNGGQVVAREVGQVSIAADWQMLASAANETVDVVPAQFLSLELRTPTDVVGEGLTLMLTAYAHYTDEVIPVILDMYTLSYESTGGDIDVAFSAEGVSITGLIKGTVELKGTYTSEKTGGTHEMFKTITVADNFYTVRVRVYDDGLL